MADIPHPSGNFLMTKAGPMPVWAWFAGGLGIALGYAYYRSKKNAALTAVGSTAGTPGYTLPSNIQPQQTTVNEQQYSTAIGSNNNNGNSSAYAPSTNFNSPPAGGSMAPPSSYNTPPGTPGQGPPPGTPNQLGGWQGAQGGVQPPQSGGYGGPPPGTPYPTGQPPPARPQPPGPNQRNPASFGSTAGGNGAKPRNNGQHNGGSGYQPGGQRAGSYGGR